MVPAAAAPQSLSKLPGKMSKGVTLCPPIAPKTMLSPKLDQKGGYKMIHTKNNSVSPVKSFKRPPLSLASTQELKKSLFGQTKNANQQV